MPKKNKEAGLKKEIKALKRELKKLEGRGEPLKFSPEQQVIIRAIIEGKAVIRKDKTWKYWTTGDDYNTCPLLKFVHMVEYHGGTLIFIPEQKPAKPKVLPITRKDVYGNEAT